MPPQAMDFSLGSQQGQSRSKTVGKEVTCWGQMGRVDGLNDLKTSSELAEHGQALRRDGKWAMSNAALCFLLNFCLLTFSNKPC